MTAPELKLHVKQTLIIAKAIKEEITEQNATSAKLDEFIQMYESMNEA